MVKTPDVEQRLQEKIADLDRDIAAKQASYDRSKGQLEPRIARLATEADALAVEFKRLVQAAASAYAGGGKAAAGALASQRRATQARCEALNAEVRDLRSSLHHQLENVRTSRARRQQLVSELQGLERQRRQGHKAGGSIGLPAYEIARRAARKAMAQPGRDLQYKEDGVKVQVKNGYDYKSDSFTTDIILIDPDRPNEHYHFVANEAGKIVQKKWNKNHPKKTRK